MSAETIRAPAEPVPSSSAAVWSGESRSEFEAALDVVRKDGWGTKAVLVHYKTLRDRAEKVGVCHDLATGIIQDLKVARRDAGWNWCRGAVDGQVDHSWVEYRGWGVDLAHDGTLRTWPISRPPFEIDGAVVRKSPADTLAWVEEQERRQRVAETPPTTPSGAGGS